MGLRPGLAATGGRMDEGTERGLDWRPWVCGAAAGSVMTTVGHPFDTLKTRMQASAIPYTSTFHCASQTVRNEGLLALYKGLQPALLTTCLTSGLRFGVQQKFNSMLVEWLAHSSGGSRSRMIRRRSSASTPTISPHRSFDDLSVGTRILAEGGGGAACGLVLPVIFTPMELIKVRRQVLKDNSVSNWQLAMRVWRESGLGGLYTGHRFTVARSTLGNASLFGSFEGWKALLRSPWLGHGDAHPWSTSVAAGVLSGWTTQLVVFPIDSAKSRLQAGAAGRGDGVGGLLPALAALWRERALYRGIESMLVRAVPVHIAYLPVYGLLMTAVS